MKTVQEFYAKDRQAWRAWLAENHATSQAVWLVFDKGSNRTLSYAALVEEALCFGWIDSRPGKVSATQSKIYVSKRKPKSAWSKINKERIRTLREEGLMTPFGEKAILIAQANGAWALLEPSDNLEVPPDLGVQLAAHPAAQSFYASLPPSSRRIILEWIYAAKTDATRQKRIAETVQLAAKGMKAHHYRA